jgi:hypothetical protein
VAAADHLLAGDDLVRVVHPAVPLVGQVHLLVAPRAERVRRHGGDPETDALAGRGQALAEPHEVAVHLVERRAHRRAHLDLAQVQLGGDVVAELEARLGEELVRTGHELEGLGVDDEELLFDAQGHAIHL